MKKRIQVVLVALVCAFAIALVGCGGNGTAGESKSGGEGKTAVQIDPSEKFIGTWKLAALKTQGVTMVGDFASVFDIPGMASESIDASEIDRLQGIVSVTIA